MHEEGTASSQARRTARVMLAHDWLVGLRGGEWVLDRLARMYGPTTIYTLVNDFRFLTEAIDHCGVKCSPLQKFPGANGKWRRHYLPLYPWAVGRLRVEECDVLISTSSAVMKGIRPPRGAVHICYCHSPARYLWEQTGDYRRGDGGVMRGAGLGLFGWWLRRWDVKTLGRVHAWVANSEHTKARMKRCWGVEAEVVYPPVRTEFFAVDESVQREDWYLVVSALEPYKKTDVVVRAALKSGWKLKVAGRGSQEDALRKLAAKSERRVEMLGRVSEEKLRELYRKAKGLIFPQVEDFGITAVEAQACGCGVIAFGAGGAKETVTERTGVFFDRQDAEAVNVAVGVFENVNIDPQEARRNAERFSAELFDEGMKRLVEEAIRNSSSR
ncbi:MAG TPA: glycosyltransferase [Phycisphaerales bacterium]|nr:glycosyltransferase [Phycisphaerales bacterium]